MLTEAQLAARKGKMTSTRIKPIMEGDPVGIDRVYRIMIDEEIEEDLQDVWPVRLGEATEALNLEWFERKQGSPLSRQGEVAKHIYLPWAVCTLDAWSQELQCPVEAKHCAGREPLEVIIDRYTPQCAWAMEITGAEQCALSVILGAAEPVIQFLKYDASYAAEMIARATAFMLCVKLRRPPVVLPPVPLPIDPDKLIDIDMSDDEKWKRFAETWLQTVGAKETAIDAEKVLKTCVPANARKCHGHGVQITRNRAGNLSLRQAQ